MECTSGIGAKLKLAIKYEKYETIGNDLVAQCVNEVLSSGAQPIAFLDYFACGKLVVPMVAKIINGIANGCLQSNCALLGTFGFVSSLMLRHVYNFLFEKLGGETAEMPALFSVDSYDLAGYCVGVVDYGLELPSKHIEEGDILVGLPANGFHCSGYDLIHEVMMKLNERYENIAPFSKSQLTYGIIFDISLLNSVYKNLYLTVDELLQPSEIYVSTLLPWIYKKHIKGIANISTGGLLRNIAKLLTGDLVAEIDASKWEIPSVYGWLFGKAKMPASTILHNFNYGIGMVAVVSKKVWDTNKFGNAIQIGKRC